MRTVLRVVAWAALGVVAGLLLLAAAPRVAGMTPLTVLSGSMRPAFAVGDLVIDEPVRPLEVRRGDVVTFTDPTRGGALVTHRVQRLRRVGHEVEFVTRGDANTSLERWSVPVDGRLGRVRMHVPALGWVLHAAGSQAGRVALLAVPAALLILLELAGLGGVVRRRRPHGRAPAPGPSGPLPGGAGPGSGAEFPHRAA